MCFKKAFEQQQNADTQKANDNEIIPFVQTFYPNNTLFNKVREQS